MIKGSKVVLIDNKFSLWVHKTFRMLPKKGKEYTVRSVSLGYEDPGKRTRGIVAIRLVGINNPKDAQGIEYAFSAERFLSVTEPPPPPYDRR